MKIKFTLEADSYGTKAVERHNEAIVKERYCLEGLEGETLALIVNQFFNYSLN